MNVERIVRAAIPEATSSVIDHILWGRTPYPCGAITPKSLYKAADSWARACRNNLYLCDLCHRVDEGSKGACDHCQP